MYNPMEEKCMHLARQWCDVNVGIYPDDMEGKPEDWDAMDKYEQHLILSSKQEEIENKLADISRFINPTYITDYYWNCIYRKDDFKMTPEEWIRWVLFGTMHRVQEFNLSDGDEDEET